MTNFGWARGGGGQQGLNDPVAPGKQPICAEFQALYSAARSATPPAASPLEFQTDGPTVVWPAVIPFATSTDHLIRQNNLSSHPIEIDTWNTTATGDGLAPVTQGERRQWATEILAQVRHGNDSFGYFDLSEGSKSCWLNSGI